MNETAKPVDSSKWFHQTILPNGKSWFNGELQHYTDQITNSFVSNGTLKIKAIKESTKLQGVTKEFSSARLNSKFVSANSPTVLRISCANAKIAAIENCHSNRNQI